MKKLGKSLLFFCSIWLVQSHAVAGDLDVAPAPFQIAGVSYSPIDIEEVNANWKYEKNDEWSAHATLTFQVKASGRPVFMFNPGSITEARLGGGVLGTSSITKDGTTLRVLEFDAIPGQTYSVDFVFGFTARRGEEFYFVYSYWVGQFFDRYIPSNLMYDFYKFNLTIDISQATEFDHVIANGEVTNTKVGFYELSFPKTYTGASFFIDLINTQKTSLFASQYGSTKITVYQDPSQSITDKELQEMASIKVPEVLADLESKFGSYPYDSVIVKYSTDLFAFAGGISFTHRWDGEPRAGNYLAHEIGHSWFLRGVHPVHGAEVWIGEGFGSWAQVGFPRSSTLYSKEYEHAGIGCIAEYNQIENGDGHWGGKEFFADLDKILEPSGGAFPILKLIFAEKKFQAMSNEEFKTLLEQKSGVNLDALFDWYVRPTQGCP